MPRACHAKGCPRPAVAGWQRHATPGERAAHRHAVATAQAERLRAIQMDAEQRRRAHEEATLGVLEQEARRRGQHFQPPELPPLQPPPLPAVQPGPDDGGLVLMHVLACPEHAIPLDEAALAHQPDCAAPGPAGCTCRPAPHPASSPGPAEGEPRTVTLPSGWVVSADALAADPPPPARPPTVRTGGGPWLPPPQSSRAPTLGG